MKRLLLLICFILYSMLTHADTKENLTTQNEINSILYQQIHSNIVILSELRNRLIENKEYVPPIIDLLILNNFQIMNETKPDNINNEKNIYLRIASCYASNTNKRQRLIVKNSDSKAITYTDKEDPLNLELRNKLNYYESEPWCLRLIP